jgi:hypothetical protein
VNRELPTSEELAKIARTAKIAGTEKQNQKQERKNRDRNFQILLLLTGAKFLN